MIITMRSRILLILAILPHIVYTLRIQQHRREHEPKFVARDLVTLEGCPEDKEFATPYNENVNGYLFAGIMFTVRTLSKSLSIKTFELDVRTDIALTDLAIEVYTLVNGYTDVYNVESAWTLVANTKVVPVPGSTSSSVLIPVQDFQKIYMPANELRSFYITMRNPYIESTVNALIGSGETAEENDVLRIDVGSGLATYKFPALFDTTVAPQFAGIIYYEEDTTEACEAPITDTKLSIDFKFLVNASGLDPTIVNTINTETKSFFDEQLENEDGYLREYKLTYQLTQLTDPTSTSTEWPLDECQSSFVSCSEITVSASFEHSDNILNDSLLYVLYTMAESLRGQLKSGLDNTVLYIGRQPRSATFTFTFDGVPSAAMSTKQLEYFQDFTKTFASNAVSEKIYEMVVQNQEVNSGSLVVTGQFLGTDDGGDVAPQLFTDNIQNELRQKNAEYIEGLAYNVIRPSSTLDKNDAGYFQDITAFQLDMEAIIQTLAPTPVPVTASVVAPTADGSGNGINDLTKKASDADDSIMVIIAVICVVCVCIVVLVLYICCRCNRKDVLDFNKNQTSTYPDIDDDASTDKKNLSSDSSSELHPETRPSMTRSESSRRPSSSSMGKTPPSQSNGLERGQSQSIINQNTNKPILARSKSGDGMPLPSRKLDFKKSHSSDGGLNSQSQRLSSLLEEERAKDERPKRRPNSSSSVPSSPLRRSKSEDGIQQPQTPTSKLRRAKSGDGISRPSPLVPPSPTASESKSAVSATQTTPSRVPPRRENSMGSTRPPLPSNAEPGVVRHNSGNIGGTTPFSPKARVPPSRAQSMNPNATARHNQSASNGLHLQRNIPSDKMRPIPPQKVSTNNNRPSPPPRSPSLERAGNTSGLPQRPGPPPRVPSPRGLEAGNSNGSTTASPIPSTPKRDQDQRTVPRTPISTPKRHPPPQQHQPARQSPQRTISLPVKNVQPNRPTVESPTKTKIEFGTRHAASDATMSSPKRTKSMPVPNTNSTQHVGNPNNASVKSPKKLSPIT